MEWERGRRRVTLTSSNRLALTRVRSTRRKDVFSQIKGAREGRTVTRFSMSWKWAEAEKG